MRFGGASAGRMTAALSMARLVFSGLFAIDILISKLSRTSRRNDRRREYRKPIAGIAGLRVEDQSGK
jgi:hypothetical protein